MAGETSRAFYPGEETIGLRKFSLVLLAAGVALIWAGLARGEGDRVLAKAVRICLECIGLG